MTYNDVRLTETFDCLAVDQEWQTAQLTSALPFDGHRHQRFGMRAASAAARSATAHITFVGLDQAAQVYAEPDPAIRGRSRDGIDESVLKTTTRVERSSYPALSAISRSTKRFS